MQRTGATLHRCRLPSPEISRQSSPPCSVPALDSATPLQPRAHRLDINQSDSDDGRCASCDAGLSTAASRRFEPSGSPVLGLTSNRGKLLLDISSRMRWPFLKTFAVSKGRIN